MFRRRVFISYAKEDQDKGHFLTAWLRAEGFEVFFARESIEPSQEFEAEIDRALDRSDVFIVLISKNANQSEWVKQERSVALNRFRNGRLKFFIPIIIAQGVDPPGPIKGIQYYDVSRGDLQQWERVATRISEQIQKKNYILIAGALILLTLGAILLEVWIGERLYYVPFVLVLGVATILFVWFKLQTRSKWLSLILFIPLAIQFISVGVSLGHLRRKESEQAKTNAFALCNAANETAFDSLWSRSANSRSHPSFVEGLRELVGNEALSLKSRTDAKMALARLGQFSFVSADLNPSDNTALFEFVREPKRWLTDSIQLDWVLSWLENDDPRIKIWGARTLAFAHAVVENPAYTSAGATSARRTSSLSPKDRDRVYERLLHALTTGTDAGVVNNCRWALWKLGADQKAIVEAERKRKTSSALDHLSTTEINDLGMTLVLVNLPGRQPFYLSDTETTAEQFREFVQEKPQFKSSAEKLGVTSCFGHDGAWYPCAASWREPGLPVKYPANTLNLPVVHVSWNDAVEFCNWLSKKEGLSEAYTEVDGGWRLIPLSDGYRLPTVEEWETGSKAGTSTLFWWADSAEWESDANFNCLVANLPDSSFTQWKSINAIAGSDGCAFYAPVKTFAPNDWGLFETIGNVAEWCQGDDANPNKPRLGGSWGDDLQAVSATSIRYEGADTSHVNVGFRIARSIRTAGSR